MHEFTADIGAYVRSYATFSFTARNLKAAPAAAIAKFKADADDILFYETDWSNVAMPSIVSIERVKDRKLVVDGQDFALNEDDARDMHAAELLGIVRLLAEGKTPTAVLRKMASGVLAKIEAAYQGR